MSSYRFCRTDDIGLLCDALNPLLGTVLPDEPLMTPAAFKQSIRDLQIWCSSCMVAFESSDPIGVLIGAKRPSGTLVHKIAVHPDHRRHGHGRHLLTSLASKLSILGPPRIIAEIPELFEPACRLFSASGYGQEATLTDFVLNRAEHPEPVSHDGGGAGFIIPVTIDDLVANDLLEDAQSQACWERSVETLTARKDEIAGLAVASDERIEAFLLFIAHGEEEAEIVSLRSFVEDDGARLTQLISRLRARGMTSVRFSKIHPAEIPDEQLRSLGFSPTTVYRRYAATASA